MGIQHHDTQLDLANKKMFLALGLKQRQRFLKSIGPRRIGVIVH
jgi:hypothetical protein